MTGKKLVAPGEHLASCEEFVQGSNTFTEKDDIYAAAFGELESFGRMVQVHTNTKTFMPISEGTEAYCIVREITATKAFLSCAPILKENERSFPSFDAVLPVSEVRQGYVEQVRDEVRIGDILKAKVIKIDKQQNIDVSIAEQGYGVIRAFCSRCRSNMIIKDGRLTCTACGRVESRKLPYGAPPAHPREQRREFRRGSYGSKYPKFR